MTKYDKCNLLIFFSKYMHSNLCKIFNSNKLQSFFNYLSKKKAKGHKARVAKACR